MPRIKKNTDENKIVENEVISKDNQQTVENDEILDEFKTEEAPKIQSSQVEILMEEGKTIIVQAKEGLSYGQFELLSKMLKSEEKNTQYKIVLIPYSVDSVEIK